MKQIFLNNKSYILGCSWKIFSGIFTVLGFLALFVPLDVLLDGIDDILLKFLIVVFGAAVVFSAILALVTLVLSKKNSVELFGLYDDHKLFLEYGDVLEDKKSKCIKVFAANRCFDTIVDDDLIGSNTIHGKMVNGLLRENVYTLDQLDAELSEQLSREDMAESISLDVKRKGKLERYPAGTIVETKGIYKDEKMFWLGLTWFDRDLHPHVSKEEYIDSLSNLMRYLIQRSQQFTVYMPIIGAGASNVASDKELLKYMIETIRLYKNELNCDVHIVVWNGKKNKIGLLESR